MNKALTIKRPLVWVKRFRNRCGYGVHSPSAFDFITNVIYEKASYYAYEDIENSDICKILRQNIKNKKYQSTKKDRLLFRLVNRLQPQTIIEIGEPTASSLYLQAAKKQALYAIFPGVAKYLPNKPQQIGLLYIQFPTDVAEVKRIIEEALPCLTLQSAIVIEGIHYNTSMCKMWKELEADERVITTFDLYDFGFMFFDSRRIKQKYVVNF
ncbi:hypothetical protein LJC72_08605 [Bacteroides sp. OttesenSCG-928-D19]|nr:hypothetical protein [Bacteroides sp. OttesenSCG-928-D19]